jgi:NTE family protein
VKKVGLVLGAGGVVGRAFHAGVLAAIQDVAQWDAREAAVIVGTSAGAVDGALLRAGVSARDLAARSTGEPLSAEGAHLFRHAPLPINTNLAGPPYTFGRPAAPECFFRAARRPWALRLGALAAAALPEGLIPAETLTQLIQPMFDGGWPERHLWICTVRLEDARREVFGRDALPSATVAEAVRASCAIPGWFAPVRIGGARFVDGGAYSLTNLDVLSHVHLDLVVVSSPMSAVPSAWRSSFDGSLRAMMRLRLQREIRRVAAGGAKVVVLEPDEGDLRVMGSMASAMDGRRRASVTAWIRDSMRSRVRQLGLAELLPHPARSAGESYARAGLDSREERA